MSKGLQSHKAEIIQIFQSDHECFSSQDIKITALRRGFLKGYAGCEKDYFSVARLPKGAIINNGIV